MSIVDKILATVSPTESSDDRRDARAKARAAATSGDWLSLVLEHHLKLEAAFAAAKAATGAAERLAAQKALGIILVGHAGAEETVLYPAMGEAGEGGHGDTAYDEQVMVKKEMAKLEALSPTSQEHAEKLEEIRVAVAHHMYEEEGTWYPYLKANLPAADQAKLTARYLEEFERYVRGPG